MRTNEAQRAVWNTPDQAEVWQRRERVTNSITKPLLERLGATAGERVLDIGCGGGLAAIEVAKVVGPGGSVLGFDLSAPLVGLSTRRAAEAGAGNVQFVAGDAQTDHIPGGPFDAAMSQLGVMFFADPVAAFTNIRRHLRPGGRLVFACWQPQSRNTWYPGAVVAKYLPVSPPLAANGGPAPGPFAFGDAAYANGVLTGAGFGDVRCEPLTLEVAVPDDTIHDREALRERGLDAAQQTAAWADLQAMAESLRGADGLLHLRLAPQIISATNAG